MKVAIIGTHGTGKSTLVYGLCFCLKQEGLDVKPVLEIARESPFPLNGKDFRAQEWIVHKQSEVELAAETTLAGRDPPDCFVFDRCVLDGYVYSLDMKHKGKITHLPEWMSTVVNANVGRYDYLFRANIYKGGLERDGTRSIDPVWQREIDDLFDHVSKKKRIKYLRLPMPKDFDPEKKMTKDEIKEMQDLQLEFMVQKIVEKCKK